MNTHLAYGIGLSNILSNEFLWLFSSGFIASFLTLLSYPLNLSPG